MAIKHLQKILLDVLNAADVYTTTDGGIQSIVAGGAASPVINPAEIGVTNFCTWNSSKNSIKGTDVANALIKIGRNPGFENTGDWIKGLKHGKVIACVSGVWDETAIKGILSDNYAATILPSYTVAGKQVQMSCYFGYKMLGVNPYSKYLDWPHKLANSFLYRNIQGILYHIRKKTSIGI